MSGSTSFPLNFFNNALPNQLSFLTAGAGFNPSQSAFTQQGWNYTSALSPQLLSSVVGFNEATQSAGIQTIANLGAMQFATINQDFTNWGNAQGNFLAQIGNTLQTAVKKSATAGGGLLGLLGL